MEKIPDKGEQMRNLVILNQDGTQHYGHVDLLCNDGKLTGLYNIEITDPAARKQGIGAKVVETLLSDPKAKIDISNIVTESRGFWDKVGVPEQNVPHGDAYDGKLDWEAFSRSKAGRAAIAERSIGEGKVSGLPGRSGGSEGTPAAHEQLAEQSQVDGQGARPKDLAGTERRAGIFDEAAQRSEDSGQDATESLKRADDIRDQGVIDRGENDASYSIRDKKDERALPVSERVDAETNVDSAFKFAATRKFATNREFKLELQARAREAAKSSKVDLSETHKGVEDYLTRVGLKDALSGLRDNANAVGWYNEKVNKALRIASLIHPELRTDPEAKFAFTWALAVTSNGMKVGRNFELAEKAYSKYKANGEMPTDVGEGTAGAKINESLESFNRLRDKWGMAKLMDFATTKASVKQVEKESGLTVTGEGRNTEVYGAAVLGPKIGNGFFMNLHGQFDQLTMDRWLMRTWGRWTGALVNVNKENVAAKREALRGVIRMLTPADKKLFEKVIGTKLTVSNIDQVAANIKDMSAKPELRELMNEVAPTGPAEIEKLEQMLGRAKKGQDRLSLGGELRKLGNGLTMLNDGQKEAPAGSRERDFIRKVFGRVLDRLQQDHPNLTMADLQAVVWYPEKRLYDAAKTSDNASEGYADDEAPDYANAAAALARSHGITDAQIAQANKEVDHDIATGNSTGSAGRRDLGVHSERAQEGRSQSEPAYSVRDKAGRGSQDDRTDTPEFKKWFGDSKVVDRQGKPLVVYHGTASDISEFDKRSDYEGGIYFTSDPRYAGGRARIAQGMGNGDTPNTMPVYVSIKNPAPASMSVAEAKALGHDGIIRDNEVVAFSPTQIKSATGNSGAYDPKNPDIRYSVRDEASLGENYFVSVTCLAALDSGCVGHCILPALRRAADIAIRWSRRSATARPQLSASAQRSARRAPRL